CDTCKQSFRRTEHLLRHLRCHSGEKPYPCTVCSRGFSRLDALQRHLRCHSPPSPKDATPTSPPPTAP
ncbi:hypothetical protein BDK51DRAFT_15067, partial [Blyttiomyces helicus]